MLMPFAANAAELPQIDIPDAFESVALNADDAYDFVKGCTPEVTQSAFTQMVANAGDNKTVTNRPGDKSRPYLSVTGGKAYCVRISDAKYPIVATSTFENTIMFYGMAKDQEKKLRTDLSRQLAARGYATATVIGDKGSAYIVSYLFSAARPVKMYYHLTVLKPEDVKDGNGGKIYLTQGGEAEVTRNQGGEQENVRYFFTK
jgi:hypothetical protein